MGRRGSSTHCPVPIESRCGQRQGVAVTFPMSNDYWQAYADARSSLGALADMTDIDDPSRYDSLLIQLDGIQGGVFPATPAPWTAAELLTRLEDAVDRMIEQGGDGLSLELLLAEAGVW